MNITRVDIVADVDVRFQQGRHETGRLLNPPERIFGLYLFAGTRLNPNQ